MAAKKQAEKPAYEDKWRAGEDARTLAAAEEIRRDRQRHSAAKKHVQQMVKAVMPPRKKIR